jgi:rod shape-determining protein MreD
MPMPDLCQGIKPMWALLLLFYIQFYLPDYFHLLTLFVLGLLLDILLSTVIGEHIFALTLVTWIASNKARRFYFFSIGQQMALIAFFCLLYQLIILTVEAFLGLQVNLFGLFGNPLVTALLWPVFCVGLELSIMPVMAKKM